MAKIRLSEILQNISGSVDNHTFSCWKGINLLKSKAVSISNPRSQAQQLLRARHAAASQYWYNTLTQGQRDLWEEFAQQQGSASKQTGPNSNGGCGTKSLIPSNGGVMSGFNMFCKVNGDIFNAGVATIGAFIEKAPMGTTGPTAPTALACVPCFDTPYNVIRLAWTDPVVIGGSSRIRVWLVSLDAGVSRQMVASVAGGVETYDIDLVSIALGAHAHVHDLPGHYHVQLDCIGDVGIKSPPSNICQCEITTAEEAPCGF